MPPSRQQQPASTRSSEQHNQLSPVLIKILFQILQCLHHCHNVDPQTGRQQRAFLRKEAELVRFIKPAQETAQFRDNYRSLVKSFFENCLGTLNAHYKSRIEFLKQQLSHAKPSEMEMERASEVAMRWARKNFGKKLSYHTVRQFYNMIRAHRNSPTPQALLPQRLGTTEDVIRAFPPLTSTLATTVPPPLLTQTTNMDIPMVPAANHDISLSPVILSQAPPVPPVLQSTVQRATLTTTDVNAPSAPSADHNTSLSPVISSQTPPVPPVASPPEQHTALPIIEVSTPVNTSLPTVVPPQAPPVPPVLPPPEQQTTLPITNVGGPVAPPADLDTSLSPVIPSQAPYVPPVIAPPEQQAILSTPTNQMTQFRNTPSYSEILQKESPKHKQKLPSTNRQAMPSTSKESPTEILHSRRKLNDTPSSSGSSPSPPPSPPSLRSSSSSQRAKINPRSCVNITDDPTDPLSNSFPLSLTYKGNTFLSAEHAYQYEKASFLDDFKRAEEILAATTTTNAKAIGKRVSGIHKGTRKHDHWVGRKRFAMEDILWAKMEQCVEFRDALLATGTRRLTFNEQSEYWGTTFVQRGRTEEGQNIFAFLLFRIRSTLASRAYSTPPLRRRQSPSLSPPPVGSYHSNVTPLPPTVVTPNPYSPLQGTAEALPTEEGTDLTSDNRAQNPTPVTTNPDNPRRDVGGGTRGGKPLSPQSVTGPHIVVHHDKRKWRPPVTKSKGVILGDSNIKIATKLETKAISIECHSFPGAKVCHFGKMFCGTLPQMNPSSVVISVGINNRENQATTNRQQLRQLVDGASKAYPNATIHIPQVNIPSKLPQSQQETLRKFNSTLQELETKFPKFHTVPQLPQNKFKIDPRDTRYGIHWTTETANAMMSHWSSHLN